MANSGRPCGHEVRYSVARWPDEPATEDLPRDAATPFRTPTGTGCGDPDAGSDGDALVEVIEGRPAEAVIPSRANRSEPPARDRHTFEERNVAERFRAQAEPFRRVATRYDKKAANVLGFVWVAALTVMLK